MPMHFFVMLSISVLNVSLLSSVKPSSLTSLLSSIVSPQTSMGRRDHFLLDASDTKCLSSLFAIICNYSTICNFFIINARDWHSPSKV